MYATKGRQKQAVKSARDGYKSGERPHVEGGQFSASWDHYGKLSWRRAGKDLCFRIYWTAQNGCSMVDERLNYEAELHQKTYKLAFKQVSTLSGLNSSSPIYASVTSAYGFCGAELGLNLAII